MTLGLDRVSKTYFRQGRPVVALDNVTLDVHPGELIAILGGRGAGKTTLLKVAAGLERPDSGNVSFAGRRLDELSDLELTGLHRTQVGCLWSTGAPVEQTSALDFVALPLRLQSGDGRSALVEAERALQAVDAGHCAAASLDELSDGERQLVAVAQALVAKPRLLLLDQPATNLRLADEQALLRVLRSLAQEARVAILMTATNATEASAAQSIASMSDGRMLLGDSFARRKPSGGADVVTLKGRKRGGGNGARRA